MKKSFICFVCLCFPLIAMSNEPTYHDTCQIQIYRNFSELTQVKYENFPNSIIRYNTDTKIGIEKLFKDKG
ncbi:MAG: hypothetical protein NTY22_00685, partial [Proteobacteria bacterium]|nr:hypothetical protein [Pseudomonadota bacterium]